MVRLRFVVATLVALLATACGGSPKAEHPAFLDSGADRPAIIHALDTSLCRDQMQRTAQFQRFWVGLCKNRGIFEAPVYFMVFNDAAGMRDYLDRIEACVPGRYVQGPRWFAMAVRPGDEKVLLDRGAKPLPCTNSRLPGSND